jgi:DNA-binding CsgD family transcriptional regulator
LDPELISAIVRERTGWSPTKPETARLAELSGGNPFYALEIARARARGDEGVTGQRMPIPRNLRDDLVRTRVGDVARSTRDVLLFAAAMARPNVRTLRRALPDGSLDRALQEAIDTGAIEVTAGDVRFTHSIYRSVIYADASRKRRHDAHARLADVVTDDEERAGHLALSVDGPDRDVAEVVERAAAATIDRGAPDLAAELFEHALRITPPEDRDALHRRRLLAARARLSAGDTDGARARTEEGLRGSHPGMERAEALRLIAAVDLARGALAEALGALDEALAQAASDPRSVAEIHRDLARVAIRAGAMGAAERNVATGMAVAERVGDPLLIQELRTTRAEVDVLLARPAESFERIRVSDGPGTSVSDSPELVKALAETLSGELQAAEERLGRLVATALDRGDEPGRLLVTDRLVELKVRAGSWRKADDLAEEARRLAIEIGADDRLGLGLAAYAAAGHGRADAARRLAEKALEAARGDRPAQLWCHSALGFLELSLARFPDALRHLTRAGGMLAETGVADPSAFPFLADEAEALVATGDGGTAAARTDALEQESERLDRDLLRGQAARCRGIVLAAQGDVSGSLGALDRSVDILLDVGIPMETGRSLLALGISRRRDRQKRPAREVLERALEAFEEAEALLWTDRARDEIARIGGRRASVGELTEGEYRAARLAAAGLTNREIAQTLFLDVRTVEGTLSRVYAKLGLRGRVELALFFDRSE